jgi:hypothetical protein
MGWASGMQAGTAMARNWIDTYRSADEARRIKKVTDDKQQETYAFDKDTLARIAADQAAGKSLQATVGDDGAPVYHSFPAATPAQQQFTQGIVDPLPRTQSGQGLAPLSGAQPPRQLGVVGPGIDQQIDDYIEQGSAGLAREPLFPQGRSQRPLPRTSNGEGLATAAPPTDSESVAYRAKQQWTYGGRNYDAPLSEEALRLEQQRRIGIEVQKYRPEEGLRMQNDAARAMREEELHPLAVQAQKQGIESTGYTLRGQQRTEESTLRVNSFMAALSQPELQGRPLNELMDIGAKEYGLNRKELISVIEAEKNYADGTLGAITADLKLRTHGLDMSGLIEFYAKEIADGAHIVPRTVAGGKIVLDTVDDNDPSRVISSTPAFDSPAHAEKYLRARVLDPDVAVAVADAQRQRDREAAADDLERQKTKSGIGLDQAKAVQARAAADLDNRTNPNIRAGSGSGYYSTRGGTKVPAGSILQGYTADGPVTAYTRLDPETNTVMLVDTQTNKPVDVPFVPNSEVDPKAIAAAAAKLVGTVVTAPDGRPRRDSQGKPMRHSPESAQQTALNMQLASHLGWRVTDEGLPAGKSAAFGGGGAATKPAPATPAPASGQGLQTSAPSGAGRNARQDMMIAYAAAEQKREAERKAAAGKRAEAERTDAYVRRITGRGLISAPAPTLTPKYLRQRDEDERYWGILRQQ